MISPTKITKANFDSALSRYDSLIKSISDQKTSKSPARGEKSSTLAELDEFRFQTAPSRYSKDIAKNPSKFLSKNDVIELITWKLKHGTFRPTLLSLAQKNTDDELESIITDAFESYDNDGDSAKAVDKLSKLKGIGPATGSLLLSVHDATRVVFFGDEVYEWLSGVPKKDIKYTLKEYRTLVEKSQALIRKLGVDARNVEKVGFVLIKEVNEGSKKEEEKEKPKKVKEDAPKAEKSAEEVAARKAQLVEMAAKGRRERDAKRAARAAKGAAFRARVDSARELGKKEGTFVVKPQFTPTGKPRGRPPGNAKRSASSENTPTAASKRPKRE